MIARYAASQQIPGFDFFLWLVLVKAKGATRIAIDPSRPKQAKYTAQEVTRRFHNIIMPGPALANLPCWIGTDEPQIVGSAQEFFNDWNAPFDRLVCPKKPSECGYTVTLRNSYRVPNRNSGPAWRQFAQEIGAIIIEDYYDEPIHLHDRMSYYAGAKMNFLINQGPTNLLSVTPYPFVNFVTDANRRPYWKIGILPESKLRWMLPNQHFVWKNDTIENLRESFEQWG